MKKLFILESPGKVKKVQEILGTDWKVMASVGHVRDLPAKEMGVEAPDFRPHYVPTERGADVLKRLKAAVQGSDEVYLATDPDREGEAIAWHIADALRIKSAKRVTYGEITKSAILAAIKTPRAIDIKLVAAQEARRVLDRFCGYMVSGPLSRAAGKPLSAGRVQSPAARLVVERERAIRGFVSVTHYGAELTFTGGWRATWITKPWLEKGQEYFLDSSLAERVAALRNLVVVECKESANRVAPPPPFTTSSLQQAASNAFGITPKQTMQLAQKLYEGGHITYMRTDSPNLSAEAVTEIRAFCEASGWPLVDKPRTWKSKEGAQEAHEAIRPTHIEAERAGETADELALYQLIRMRTLASQLADAVYDVRVVRLQGVLDGKVALFEARGRVLRDLGWKVLTASDVATDDEDENTESGLDNPVPKLADGQQTVAANGKVLTKKTMPPGRFTHASLVRELENRGIGRPATFAAIVDTIIRREYVRVDKRSLVATLLGEQVVDLLCGAFSFVEYAFTRKMEDGLDAIAEGSATYKGTIASAFEHLQCELALFMGSVPAALENTGQRAAAPNTSEYACPKCGNALIHRKGISKKTGRPYDFFGCSVRECDATFNNNGGKPDFEKR